MRKLGRRVNVEMNSIEILGEEMNWIQLAQDRVQRRWWTFGFHRSREFLDQLS